MARNIKLVLEYDGTCYHGWQAQAGSGRPTIQETLEAAISRLSGEAVTTVSSGRTDAGVHALGHVANFHTSGSLPPGAWAPALNLRLPPDIRVLTSEEARPDFHARYSARSKIYQYRILNRREPTALLRHYAWQVNRELDVKAMQQAAGLLIGTQDFSAFRASACTAKSPIRTITRADTGKNGEMILIQLEADSFLQHMVRNIAGTLVEVGLGRFRPEDVRRMLNSRNRSEAGRTAPSCGLYLVHVRY